jgi:hypothetical protein
MFTAIRFLIYYLLGYGVGPAGAMMLPVAAGGLYASRVPAGMEQHRDA